MYYNIKTIQNVSKMTIGRLFVRVPHTYTQTEALYNYRNTVHGKNIIKMLQNILSFIHCYSNLTVLLKVFFFTALPRFWVISALDPHAWRYCMKSIPGSENRKTKLVKEVLFPTQTIIVVWVGRGRLVPGYLLSFHSNANVMFIFK